ncbi:DUF4331 family protein [Pseudoduganella sp. RAF53_2]|uniref:DUF4331 family protein n=1 Tax=unclassified Pseudoduganella TaxID=2637179 RepID=UPI003F9846C3
MKRVFAGALLALTALAQASDHLDSPKVIADPRMDIGDIYAWMSPDARQLNLVMAIVGHSFSKDADYVFHIDSAKHVGATTATVDIACRLNGTMQCKGIHKMQLFAGLRDDPFFNNVKGSRDAFNYAAAAIKGGVQRDDAGCPLFSAKQTTEFLKRWRSTDGGPGTNFLKDWTPATIVLSVDVASVAKGGPLLAVWAETSIKGTRIDRMGRPLTGNALLAPLEADEVSDQMKIAYNEATPSTSAQFVPEIEKSLALYDGYDGKCGNQLMIDAKAPPEHRYRRMAELLADDRLWVNSTSGSCTQLFGVEMAAAGDVRYRDDCGGRALDYDAVNVYRSLLAAGRNTGIDDGVHRDEVQHSNTVFPFVAPPATPEGYRGK